MGNLVSQDIEGGYKRFCEELLTNNVTSGCLHWASPPLKKEQLDHFIDCLGKNNCLKKLVLRDIDTLRADSPALAKVIQKHPALQCLGFSGRLPKDKEAFEVFMQAFSQSATLTELEIENSIVPSPIVDGVLDILKANKKITSLKLKGCQMEAELLNKLTKALSESTAATTLISLEITLKPPIVAVESAQHLSQFLQAKDSVLQDVQFSGFLETALPPLLQGAKGHATLKRLTLDGKGIDDDASMDSISQFLLDAPALHVLNASSCNWNGACGVRLAETLQNPKAAKLKEMRLAHNSVGNQGTIALSKALEDKASPFRASLEVLDLRLNGIGTEGIVALAKALQTNPTALKELHIGEESIRNNRSFEGEDIEALAEMLKTNTTLERLQLEDASFSDEGLAKLLEALTENTTLKQLQVTCYTTASLESIVTSIPHWQHLKTISIRALGETQLTAETAKSLLEALGNNKSLQGFALTELKGPNAAVYKSIEPKIQELLFQRIFGGTSTTKRTLAEADTGVSQDAAGKRSKSD